MIDTGLPLLYKSFGDVEEDSDYCLFIPRPRVRGSMVAVISVFCV